MAFSRPESREKSVLGRRQPGHTLRSRPRILTPIKLCYTCVQVDCQTQRTNTELQLTRVFSAGRFYCRDIVQVRIGVVVCNLGRGDCKLLVVTSPYRELCAQSVAEGGWMRGGQISTTIRERATAAAAAVYGTAIGCCNANVPIARGKADPSPRVMTVQNICDDNSGRSLCNDQSSCARSKLSYEISSRADYASPDLPAFSARLRRWRDARTMRWRC